MAGNSSLSPDSAWTENPDPSLPLRTIRNTASALAMVRTASATFSYFPDVTIVHSRRDYNGYSSPVGKWFQCKFNVKLSSKTITPTCLGCCNDPLRTETASGRDDRKATLQRRTPQDAPSLMLWRKSQRILDGPIGRKSDIRFEDVIAWTDLSPPFRPRLIRCQFGPLGGIRIIAKTCP
jgi:hypothetical protein